MSSATSSVREVLEGYLAGQVKADRVVTVVAEEYYRDRGRGARTGLQPLVDVIEGAAPGAVELVRAEGGAGFALKPGGRAFARQMEPALRAAVEAVLKGWGAAPPPPAGLFSRLARALRGFFR